MEDEIVIGYSNNPRKKLVDELISYRGSALPTLRVIESFEKKGYEVIFKSSLWRSFIGIGTYKIVARRQK